MQLELSLDEKPQADLADVARLVAWLYESGDQWVKCSRISDALDLSEREVRNLASNSGGLVVSSPGSPGYKHVKHCDPEEIKAITSRLEHQAKLMGERACAIRNAFHSAA